MKSQKEDRVCTHRVCDVLAQQGMSLLAQQGKSVQHKYASGAFSLHAPVAQASHQHRTLVHDLHSSLLRTRGKSRACVEFQQDAPWAQQPSKCITSLRCLITAMKSQKPATCTHAAGPVRQLPETSNWQSKTKHAEQCSIQRGKARRKV